MWIPDRVYERAIRWADRDLETGCLVSRYSIGSHGYAQIGWQQPGDKRSTVTLCHRAIWQYLNGDIPPGTTVDHTCKNRKCVEINHLRLLTNFENARRTHGRDWPLGECINGHPNEHLRRQGDGRMRCAICMNIYRRTSRERRKNMLNGTKGHP